MLNEREPMSDPLRIKENRIIEVDIGDTPIPEGLTGVEEVGDIDTCFDDSFFEPEEINDII
jgi:hypothetical protein